MISAYFTCGNRECSIYVKGSNLWQNDTHERLYYDLECGNDRSGKIAKLYKVIRGSTSDDTVEVDGVTFGYTHFGLDSRTKRENARCALERLCKDILQSGESDV
jgi:hypothetical protein